MSKRAVVVLLMSAFAATVFIYWSDNDAPYSSIWHTLAEAVAVFAILLGVFTTVYWGVKGLFNLFHTKKI